MNPIMDRDHRMRTAPSIPHHEIIWKTGTRASLGVLVFPPLGLGSPQRHAILVPHKMLANTILPELEVHDFTRHFSLKVLSPAPHSFADGWVERLLAPSAACSTAEVRHERRGERVRRCGCGHGRGGRRLSRGRRHGLLARRRRRSVGAGRRAARRWAYGRTSLLLVVQAPRSWKRNGLAPVGRTIALELAVIHHLSPTRWWLGTHRPVRSSSPGGVSRNKAAAAAVSIAHAQLCCGPALPPDRTFDLVWLAEHYDAVAVFVPPQVARVQVPWRVPQNA